MAEIIEGINSNGIQIKSYDDILNDLQNNLNAIYAPDGDSINFNSETPDGQFTNILAQIGTDVRELILGVYNSFDPEKCTGVVQDSRYALNYITRKGGTFTVQNIDITTDRTVTLQGLDANYNDPNAASYTVSDNAGNLWYLIDTTTLLAGTTSLPFRAQNLGLVQPTIGTINNQVTKVIGVTSVNNSVAPTTLGESQESDAEFRIRRNRSTATNGQNNYDAMTGQLLELDGVTDVQVHVNNTSSTDSTGTAAYTVWVIAEGGANADIANVIYQNSSGLPTRGAVEVDVPSVSGQVFTTSFDRANPVSLYIQFDLKNINSNVNVSEDTIKEYIAENLTFTLNQPAETSYVTEIASAALLQYGSGLYALNVEVSIDGTTWTDYIASSSLKNKFVVDTTRITINEAS